MSALFKRFSYHLTRSPILTNVVSGSTVLVVGDCIAQAIERRRGRAAHYDPVRTTVMLGWAVIGDVPINLALFTAVDKIVSRLGVPARSSLPQSFMKACLFFVPGAIIRNPCFILFVTPFEHIAHNVRDGRTLLSEWESCVATVRRKFSDDLITIISTSAMVWLPINSVTFWKILPAYRTIWTSSFTVIWCTYLSMVQHKPVGSNVLPIPTSSSPNRQSSPSLVTE